MPQSDITQSMRQYSRAAASRAAGAGRRQCSRPQLHVFLLCFVDDRTHTLHLPEVLCMISWRKWERWLLKTSKKKKVNCLAWCWKRQYTKLLGDKTTVSCKARHTVIGKNYPLGNKSSKKFLGCMFTFNAHCYFSNKLYFYTLHNSNKARVKRNKSLSPVQPGIDDSV